ncbi:NIPSNAP family protein [Plantactinospora siamensis]|uniref:NIPSNAP family protein n=1 Tax=Plantactinospora siamensis TaxID=555372 RepID=A0ABV6P5D8_9ACTN
MSGGYAVVELRRYALRPGARETLIDLFDREFVESQEAVGAAVLGQFRDRDEPDRFVWLRGFADLAARHRALTDFYGGPVWRRHRDAANATMLDSDDVLLLRPAPGGPAWPDPGPRPPVGAPAPDSALVVTVLRPAGRRPFGALAGPVRRAAAAAGGRMLAELETEEAENTYPALPVRTDGPVLVLITGFAGPAVADGFLATLDANPDWTTGLDGPPEQLRLTPTGRSRLR